jgi:hypothetical protein
MTGRRYSSLAERTLVAHYRDADEETEQLGTGWYRRSRQVARELAKTHGVHLSVAAGVLAAVSPRIRWSSNIEVADALLAGREVVGIFNANRVKAERIIAGERPLAVLGGDKVRAFYRAIMGDPDAVVLDVWMMRAAGWTKASLTPREYEELSRALRNAAERVGLDPADFQAVVWSHVRGGGE